jgi:hypothetical protein
MINIHMFYIYKISNCLNNKVYIGFTYNIKFRFQKHLESVSKGSTAPIHEAMRSLGPENFSIIELARSNDKNYLLNTLEDFYIDKYDSIENGYNSRRGGAGIWQSYSKYKSVDVYDKSKNFLYTFNSMAEAGRCLDLNPVNISMACKNAHLEKGSQVKGYWFCYSGEKPIYKKTNTKPGLRAAIKANTGKKRPEHAKKVSEIARKKDSMNIYKFKHISGKTFTGSRYQLIEAFPRDDIKNYGLSAVLNGSQKSHRGWKFLS